MSKNNTLKPKQNLRVGTIFLPSKPQLGEKPTVLPSLEPLLEPCLCFLTSHDFLILSCQAIRSNKVLQIHIQSIPSRHQVLIVNNLNETLDPRFLCCFLGRVFLYNLAWVLLDPCDQAMTIGAVSGSIIKVLDDHCLATSISALEDYDGLVGFEKLHHCRCGLGFLLPSLYSLWLF